MNRQNGRKTFKTVFLVLAAHECALEGKADESF